MTTSSTTMPIATTDAAPVTPSAERNAFKRELKRDRPPAPLVAHLREFTMPDGRRLLVDRRSISFLCESKPLEGNRPVTIIAFRAMAKPCPVLAPYDELVAWWRGDAEEGNHR